MGPVGVLCNKDAIAWLEDVESSAYATYTSARNIKNMFLRTAQWVDSAMGSTLYGALPNGAKLIRALVVAESTPKGCIYHCSVFIRGAEHKIEGLYRASPPLSSTVMAGLSWCRDTGWPSRRSQRPLE
jgi:hypothetical protein